MERGGSNSKNICVSSFALPTYNLTLPQETGIAFLSVINSLLACPTFLANFLVILVIWNKPNLRSNAVYLLGFLAVTDALVGLAAQPLFVAYSVQVLVYKTPSCFVMVAYDLLSFLLCFWSATTSLIVTIDRCVAVLYPYKYARFLPARRLSAGVAIAWLAWFVYVFSRLVGASGRVFALVRSSLFLVSIVVTSAVYTKMVLISRASPQRRITSDHPTPAPRASLDEWGVLKTAVYVVGAYLVCYLPLTICLQVFFFVRPPKQARFLWAHWCTTVVFVNSLLNPLIYWWRVPRLRRALKAMLKLRTSEEEDSSEEYPRHFTELSKTASWGASGTAKQPRASKKIDT